jgi:SpoVK/Ycf46/Vps4 family AAA+-type ATPase
LRADDRRDREGPILQPIVGERRRAFPPHLRPVAQLAARSSRTRLRDRHQQRDQPAPPPELTRKGRFDEIFFIDLPTRDERKQIFTIHLKKRGRNPAGFDLDQLAAAAEGFTGAEIEQVVVAGLYTAFSRGVELSTSIVAEELRSTKPLSVTRREEIDALRAWARDRTVMAS